MKTVRALAVLLVLAVLGLVAAGCGDSTPSADSGAVAKEIKKQLSPKLPLKTKDVSCPGGVEGKVGKTRNCILTYDGGTKVEVRVTVTSVNDDRIGMNFLVTRKVS